MNASRAGFCALFIAGAAFAHPVVLEEVATLSPPDASWQYLGRSGVAIDGDFALVSAKRSIAIPLQKPAAVVKVPRLSTGVREHGLTRVFVDDKLQLSTSADPGPAIRGYSDSRRPPISTTSWRTSPETRGPRPVLRIMYIMVNMGWMGPRI